jgi:hypothetical protein
MTIVVAIYWFVCFGVDLLPSRSVGRTTANVKIFPILVASFSQPDLRLLIETDCCVLSTIGCYRLADNKSLGWAIFLEVKKSYIDKRDSLLLSYTRFLILRHCCVQFSSILFFKIIGYRAVERLSTTTSPKRRLSQTNRHKPKKKPTKILKIILPHAHLSFHTTQAVVKGRKNCARASTCTYATPIKIRKLKILRGLC